MPLPQDGLDPISWLSLDLIPEVGRDSVLALLRAFKSPGAVLAESESSLSRIVGSARARAVLKGPDPARVAEAMSWLEHPQHHLLTLADGDYPALLMQIPNPPPMLYLKGRRELLGVDCIAVVGSRNATPGGLQNAEQFSRALSDGGLTIISGLAMGIDASAHRGGLAGRSSTIAVVGTGLDRIYPSRNKPLAQQIADEGLIVSEFPLGTPALAANFPRRNRIISGLSKGVLVVEAALASGSLITARQAGEQGREVFAIPGSIHSPLAKGAHELIKQGAKLVDDANDIFVELVWRQSESAPTAIQGELAVDDNANAFLLQALGFDPASIDELSTRTTLPTSALVAQLMELEIAGRVAQLPGGKYQRLT
jgi:DNA processing protein